MSTDTVPRPYPTKEEIIAHARKFHPADDMSIVERAYDYAENAHKDQKRKSGEPYFVHPCAVAIILADIMMDADTIAAGLLHDVVEDVEGVTVDDIKKEFGPDVAMMVDGVTKLSQMDFFTKNQAKIESIRKMFSAMAKEIRVVFIKLADRLHNMRTLDTQVPERRLPIAKETLDIFAPLAHRLGVYSIKSELEDLCIKYIDPEQYTYIQGKLDADRESHDLWLGRIKDTLTQELPKYGITHFTVSGRIKHVYSIYRKMKAQNKSYDEIMDLVAVRIIVQDLKDCYGALGLVHSIWRPVPGRIKDYITTPKYGIYQSLHTTVIGEKHMFEVQIRTEEMHQNAEYGIAAHWRYKEGHDAGLDHKLDWLNQIIDWTGEELDPDQFNLYLRTELFKEDVFVLTPAGDVIALPKGATPIDFAYKIHSAVGNRCVGAKIDGKLVPLSTPLENGNLVEILTSKASKGPSIDWLNLVKTGEAKAKIRSFLKNASRDENLARGRERVEAELKRLGYTYAQLFVPEYLDKLFKHASLSSLDDLFVTIGFGGLSTGQVLNRLIDEYKKAQKIEKKNETKLAKASRTFSEGGVVVEGDAQIAVKFAHCCNPLPGDSIVGYVTVGRGVSIHRADCINMHDPTIDRNRFVNVSWAGETNTGYEASIQVRSYDKTGLLADMSNMFAELGVPITEVQARSLKNGTSLVNLTLLIKNTEQLDKVIRQMSRRNDIIEVFRTGQ